LACSTASTRSSASIPAGGWHDRRLVAGDGAVEADDGVEVDHGPALHLGRLAERQPDPGRVDAAGAGESADVLADRFAGASPQLAGLQVPHDLGGVVVAVQAERRTEPGVVGFMAGVAE
jgi:hypothetical protein